MHFCANFKNILLKYAFTSNQGATLGSCDQGLMFAHQCFIVITNLSIKIHRNRTQPSFQPILNLKNSIEWFIFFANGCIWAFVKIKNQTFVDSIFKVTTTLELYQ